MTSKINIVNIVTNTQAGSYREEKRAYVPNSFLGMVDVNENVLGCGDGEGC